MILRDNGEIESKEESDCESMLSLEDASDVEYPKGGGILFIKKALNIQVKEEIGDDIQSEHFSHQVPYS